MRYALAAVILVTMKGKAFAKEEVFPTALQGLWAETPQVCDLLRSAPGSVPSNRYWIYISSNRVNGTSVGMLIKAINSQAAEVAIEGDPPTVVEYAIRPGVMLHASMPGANTAMQYVRCH